jgi:predicted transglutaminase-like cysteine proteinase
MQRHWLPRFGAVLTLVIGTAACSSTPEVASELPLGLPAVAPGGYLEMCDRLPDQCPERRTGLQSASLTEEPQTVALDTERWNQLNDINLAVNRSVRYETDEAQFGREDYWQPAVTRGDCKDYALAKRSQLWAAGWPAGSLGIAIVYSPRTQTHAVLVVHTDHGAYVLDNTSAWLKPWSETDYTWLSAQDSSGQWRLAGESSHAVLLAAIAGGLVPAGNGSADYQRVAVLSGR